MASCRPHRPPAAHRGRAGAHAERGRGGRASMRLQLHWPVSAPIKKTHSRTAQGKLFPADPRSHLEIVSHWKAWYLSCLVVLPGAMSGAMR